jgi:hypothetical protein
MGDYHAIVAAPVRAATGDSEEPTTHRRGAIDDLIGFAAAGNRMGCIVVDPPWSILGSTLPYEAIEFDELKDLPIPELAAERCHLHV